MLCSSRMHFVIPRRHAFQERVCKATTIARLQPGQVHRCKCCRIHSVYSRDLHAQKVNHFPGIQMLSKKCFFCRQLNVLVRSVSLPAHSILGAVQVSHFESVCGALDWSPAHMTSCRARGSCQKSCRFSRPRCR